MLEAVGFALGIGLLVTPVLVIGMIYRKVTPDSRYQAPRIED